MKKLNIIGLLLATILIGALALTSAQPVYADTCAGDSSHFLGLKAWYSGLTIEKNGKCTIEIPQGEDGVKKYVWTIVLNVVSMVLGVVGYLCVALVIWGGYLYMLANGDVGKVAKGKKTIVNALIGLAVCMLASIISGAISDIVSQAKVADAGFFQSLANTAFVWAGIICTIIIIMAGISYATSIGDPGKVSKAKSAIVNAAIGLLITLFAAAIVNVMIGAIG